MYNTYLRGIIAFVIILFVSPLQSNAESDMNTRNEVLDFLENAFEAQISLNEKPRDMDEIHEILRPYFTEKYEKQFLEENLVTEGGKHIVYGSDFSPYFIPFFQFSESTKIVIEQDEIFVFEHFPSSEDGPVTYEGHYEGLRLEKEEGNWKVEEYIYDDIPEEIKEKANKDQVVKTGFPQGKDMLNKNMSDTFEQTLSPFEAIITFGTLILNGVSIPLK